MFNSSEKGGIHISMKFVDEISKGLNEAVAFILMNPDCRDEKHRSCSGEGWDELLDESCPCPCECHKGADNAG